MAAQHFRAYRPLLESLESRNLPDAKLNAVLTGGILRINGTDSADSIYVYQFNGALTVSGVNIQVSGQPVSWVSAAQVSKIVIYGYGGNDTIRLDTHLFGGQKITTAAEIYGGAGNDALTGGGGKDLLFGEAGLDVLRGGDGDDVLDAGSKAEDVDGQAGWDRDVWTWAAGGTKMTDVKQTNSPTCSFHAALAGLARLTDLSGRITYLGNNFYRVALFRDSENRWINYDIRFDGSTNSTEPAQVAEGKYWTVVFHRAWVAERAALGKSVAAWPDEAMLALTGKPATGYATNNQATLRAALAAGQNVVTATWFSPTSNPKLITNHAYTVVSIDAAGNVTIRNPWARDGGSVTSGDPNDGLIVLSWAEFKAAMQGFWVS